MQIKNSPQVKYEPPGSTHSVYLK